MKHVGNWWWPDGEEHMLTWLAEPRNRVILNGRESYQGRKQIAAMAAIPTGRHRTAIDCGAHIGLWSFNLAKAFRRVEAFEPVEAHRECFLKNVLDDNVILHPYALGEKDAMVKIRVNPTSSGDSWVKGKGNVEQHVLDNFGFQDVDFIKVDAEGYEEFILRGAVKTLEAWHPVVCVEQKRDMAVKFGLKPQGAITFLRGLGYKVADEISGDYILVHD